MFTKVISAGDLFPYVEEDHDMMNKEREEEPAVWRGIARNATRLLEAQMPPHVREDRKRQWVRHSRRHLTHIMNCFAESKAVVESVLPQVIPWTEDLFLAGLPRDALYFCWYEHPQERGAHTHAGLVNTVLPAGGPYHPRLRAELRTLFDRLVSRRLGLVDPLAADRMVPVLAGWGSWKEANEEAIRKVVAAASAGCDANRRTATTCLHRHADFLELLQQHEFEILAAPALDGWPVRRVDWSDPVAVPLYAYTVVVRGKQGEVILFRGPLCRPDFKIEMWDKQVAEQKLIEAELVHHPERVYKRFVRRLTERIKVQQRDFRSVVAKQDCVRVRNFRELDPATYELPPLLEPSSSSEPSMCSILHYPFVCEWESPREDIAEPLACQSNLDDLVVLNSEVEENDPESPAVPAAGPDQALASDVLASAALLPAAPASETAAPETSAPEKPRVERVVEVKSEPAPPEKPSVLRRAVQIVIAYTRFGSPADPVVDTPAPSPEPLRTPPATASSKPAEPEKPASRATVPPPNLSQPRRRRRRPRRLSETELLQIGIETAWKRGGLNVEPTSHVDQALEKKTPQSLPPKELPGGDMGLS